MISIVTDSTSDLTLEEQQQHAIVSVPLYVLFGGQMYKDGLEITPADIFKGLREGKKTPSTSQPSPAEFAQAYSRALETADEVLSVHISGQLSGTVGSARLAAQDFGGKVTVLDSHTTAMGLGMQAIRAAQMGREGRSMAEIVTALERVQANAVIRFTVDTLDFLRMNGRIGGAAALLGGLLNIKPILAVRGGKVDAAGRARGAKKAQADIVQFARDYAQQHGPVRASFICTDGGEATLEEMRATLAGSGIEDFGNHKFGAVIATHAGPGTYGLALEPLN
ncbi:DegV family protein [Deinococcus aquiradiocola]|uniref:DegV domain-containing protein n=1 Tax=Deinococcus aquiradiocola TaxID=393059 RepID=A0A917P4G8_9DEIO|nr:DegV family protein [Deinococcus aquiradiocola]GGJ60971.1 degV domain-containing protein [Deinococcus aquiradiocola]